MTAFQQRGQVGRVTQRGQASLSFVRMGPRRLSRRPGIDHRLVGFGGTCLRGLELRAALPHLSVELLLVRPRGCDGRDRVLARRLDAPGKGRIIE